MQNWMEKCVGEVNGEMGAEVDGEVNGEMGAEVDGEVCG